MKTAIELIADKAKRNKNKHGYTSDHDDDHAEGELAMAASCYAMLPCYRPPILAPVGWPWVGGNNDGWKPEPDNRIEELVNAGALIVAEIERLQRLEAKKRTEYVDDRYNRMSKPER